MQGLCTRRTRRCGHPGFEEYRKDEADRADDSSLVSSSKRPEIAGASYQIHAVGGAGVIPWNRQRDDGV